MYQFKCLRDANTNYIGKTTRHLATRVKEHSTSPSAIKDHLSVCNSCQSNYSCNNNFSILCSGRNDSEIIIKEALCIKYQKPVLNRQLQTCGTSFVLNIF